MRHLGSIVLALILAPLIYLLAGIGMAKTTEYVIRQGYRGYVTEVGPGGYGTLAVGILALLAAGLLYALLIMPRLSPVGLVLAGFLLLAVQVWALFGTRSFVHTVPFRTLGVAGAAFAPVQSGALLLLAVPLLATIVSPRRWRRSAQPAAATPYGVPAQPYPYQPYTPSYPPPPTGPAYPGAPGEPVPTSVPPLPVPAPATYPAPQMYPAPPQPEPPTELVRQDQPPADPDSTRKL
jgi:hypothetical protein